MKLALGFAVALALAPAQDAPAITIKSIDGREFDLAALSKDGKVLAVVSWSLDCPSGSTCVGRADAVGTKFADHAKVAYLGVSSYGDSAEKLAAYAKEKGLKYPLCHDGDKTVARALGARKVNAAFVFAGGKLFWSGGITPKGDDRLVEAIEAALAGTPAPAGNRFSG